MAAAARPSNASNIRWVVCALLFLATTINYMDRSVFSLIEPVLHTVDFMGWNPAADKFHQPVFDNNFGNILIVFQIAYGVGLVCAGRVIDRLGSRTGYALAILVWSLAACGHAFVGSVVGFYFVRILLGLGEAGNFPAAIKATSEWFPSEERAFAVGIFNSGSNFSTLVAPLLVSWLTLHYGWRSAFAATGAMGLLWLVLWYAFPYNKLRPSQDTLTQQYVALPVEKQSFFSLLATRRAWAFGIGKGLTDGIWWFYLFYLPQFLNRNYGLDLAAQYWFLVTVYLISSVGSVLGGGLSGVLMKRGFSINAGRKFAMLAMALCVVPIIFVPKMVTFFPANPWPATLLFALAAAAHQGWSANIFSTSGDMFPASAVSTIVGFGGAMGALGGAIFTWFVKTNLSLHPIPVFMTAGLAYLTALAIIHLLVPRLGRPKEAI